MIASLRGTVLSVRLDAAVVEVGGVGMLVNATPSTLATLRTGAEAQLFTSLVVREDALTLYGFASAEERDTFEILQTVSGVGPRLALAMLAVHSPDALRRAVAGEDLASLTRVPGIGTKGAQRILLELGDRLGPALGEETGPDRSASAAGDRRGEVVAALEGLGWNAKVAAQAVDAVVGDGGQVTAEDVAAVLRGALRHLGSGRG